MQTKSAEPGPEEKRYVDNTDPLLPVQAGYAYPFRERQGPQFRCRLHTTYQPLLHAFALLNVRLIPNQEFS
jgi:hypothetical protein